MRGPLGWLCGDGWRVPKEANFTYCSKPLFNSNKTTSSIKNWWKEYFVFGVVRNPYTRFASAEVDPLLQNVELNVVLGVYRRHGCWKLRKQAFVFDGLS